jgi:hypothetical protein
MFMDRAVIKVVDNYTNQTLMNESVPVSGGMSGSQSTVTLTLPIGRSFQISAQAFNNKLSATVPNFSGQTEFTPHASGGTQGPNDNQCYINLLPINPPTLSYASPVTTPTLQPAIYDASYLAPGTDGIVGTADDQHGRFIQNGAEYWAKFTATGETVSIVLTPSNYFLYASLYSEDGRNLAGGLSPSFAPPYTGGGAVNLGCGVTTGSTYYLGFTLISAGNVENPTIAGATAYLTLNGGTIAEDSSEPDDSFPAAKELTLNAGMGYANANANDPDWYMVYLAQTGSLAVSANSSSGYSNGVFGALQVIASDGSRLGMDELYQKGPGSMGKQSYAVSVPIPSPGYYYIMVDLKGSHPQYSFTTIGGPYTLMVNFTQQTFAFTSPSVGQVRKGKLLSNPGKPGLLAYLYLDQGGAFYSMRSSDNGSTWSSPQNIPSRNFPVVDFAAEMDGNGTALFLSIEADVPNARWDSVVGWLRNYESNWSGYTVWGYSMGGNLARMAYPSVSRSSSGDVLFGYGWDTNGIPDPDGTAAHTVFWNSYNQSFDMFRYVALSAQTDNPWNNQVYSDSYMNESYYMYQDNHYDWKSMDLFAIRAYYTPPSWDMDGGTEYLLVDAPDGASASQPWMGRLNNGRLVLVYLVSDAGGSSSLIYRSASYMSDLRYETDNLIDKEVIVELPWDQPDNNPVHRARTVYTNVATDGKIYVAYMKADGIYRSSINNYGLDTPIHVCGGSSAQIDGLNTIVETGGTTLYLSWHDEAGNHVERIPNL